MAIPRIQQHILRIHPACAKVSGRVGAETGQAQILQEQPRDILQVVDVMTMDGEAHRHLHPMALQGADAADRAVERAGAAAGIVRLRARSVHRHLDMVAAMRSRKKRGDPVVDQRPVREEGEPHPVADDSFEEFREIVAEERLPAGKGEGHDTERTEFVEEGEPRVRGQVPVLHLGVLEEAAVPAAQVAARGDFDVNGAGGPHHHRRGCDNLFDKSIRHQRLFFSSYPTKPFLDNLTINAAISSNAAPGTPSKLFWISETISPRVLFPSIRFQTATPTGLIPTASAVSGLKRTAQSSNSSRRTATGLATGRFIGHTYMYTSRSRANKSNRPRFGVLKQASIQNRMK